MGDHGQEVHGLEKGCAHTGAQAQKSEKDYQKKTYTLFTIWLLILAAAVTAASVSPFRIAGLGAMKSLGVVLYVMLDILFLIIYATQSVYWTGTVTYEEAEAATKTARKRYAVRHFAVFFAATAVFLAYCFVPKLFRTYSMMQDLIVMCGILCIAVITTIRIRL